MCIHPGIRLIIIFNIIHLSVEQVCKYSCLNDSSGGKELCKNMNCLIPPLLNINTTLVDDINGKVDLLFDNSQCYCGLFEINLKYNKYIKNEDECNFNSLEYKYRTHSVYYLERKNSNETYSEHIPKCKKKENISLLNIRTGCYLIYIYNDGYVVNRTYIYWETSYFKQEVDVYQTNTIYDARNNGTELKFTIKNPILNTHPKMALKIYCSNCTKRMNESKEYILIQDENNERKLILDSKSQNREYNISCDLEQNTNSNGIAKCLIFPVTSTSYDIVITYFGDSVQCPQNLNVGSKVKFKFYNVIADEPEVESTKKLHIEIIFGPILGILCGLLALLLVLAVRKLILQHSQEENKIPININVIRKEHNSTPVLLLYARNSEDIMATLVSFRNLLTSKDIEVYDIYDPEKKAEILKNCHDWILELITQNNMKIIIFLTPNGQNVSNVSQIQQPIDFIYKFAIEHLLYRITEDSNISNNIFVAHFSNDTNQYLDYMRFSPHKRYNIPNTVKELLQDVLNQNEIGFSVKTINAYNRFIEFYEKIVYFQAQ